MKHGYLALFSRKLSGWVVLITSTVTHTRHLQLGLLKYQLELVQQGFFSAKLTELFRNRICDLVLMNPGLYPTELTFPVCIGVCVPFATADKQKQSMYCDGYWQYFNFKMKGFLEEASISL